ncbi:MAG: PspC domain-containing protein [Acidimicrobiales bacterium]|jgi:phage shock protein PspC (stress-responsive transcriptional regulator)
MQSSTEHPSKSSPRSFRRSVADRKIAGVASGLAHYFDLDVTLVRVVLVAACVVSGVGVVAYLGAWLFVPEEGSKISIAGARQCAHN